MGTDGVGRKDGTRPQTRRFHGSSRSPARRAPGRVLQALRGQTLTELYNWTGVLGWLLRGWGAIRRQPTEPALGVRRHPDTRPTSRLSPFPRSITASARQRLSILASGSRSTARDPVRRSSRLCSSRSPLPLYVWIEQEPDRSLLTLSSPDI